MTLNIKYVKNNVTLTENVASLDAAINRARELGVFVVIESSNFELVGMFGATGIQHGKLPSGEDYTWTKNARRRK